MGPFNHVFPGTRHLGIIQQQGVVLIVAMVMLLVMTVAGITAMTGATLQERIAGNQRQQIEARLNADRALLAGETMLAGLSIDDDQVRVNFAGTAGWYTPMAFAGGAVQAVGFDRVNAAWAEADRAAVAINNTGTSNYLVEYMGQYDPYGFGSNHDGSYGDNKDKGKVYRVTARGTGNVNTIVSVLESYYLDSQ